MDIILYLTELLHIHKTVGIAGLGTLYQKKSPGKYDTAIHAFVPPSYKLAFTTEIKDEETLSSYISSKRNISPESASYYISEFVEQIEAQLADQQEAELGTLGKLKYRNDELILIDAQDVNFGFEFYGLPTLPEIEKKNVEEQAATIIVDEKIHEIEEENKLEEENPGQETPIDDGYVSIHDEPAEEEVNALSRPPQPLVIKDNEFNHPIETATGDVEVTREASTSEYEEDEPRKGTPFFIKFLVVFLLIVAAGAIAYFINPQFFDKYLQKNFEGKPVLNAPIKNSDTLKTKAEATGKTDSISKNNAMVALVKDSVIIDSTKKYFEVIGTSESTVADAEAYIARVAKKGIIAKQIKLSKRRFSVSIGTFTDEKKATKFRDSTRVLLKNPEIYIQPIKPKKHTK
jgi:hypothetical protein